MVDELTLLYTELAEYETSATRTKNKESSNSVGDNSQEYWVQVQCDIWTEDIDAADRNETAMIKDWIQLGLELESHMAGHQGDNQ